MKTYTNMREKNKIDRQMNTITKIYWKNGRYGLQERRKEFLWGGRGVRWRRGQARYPPPPKKSYLHIILGQFRFRVLLILIIKCEKNELFYEKRLWRSQHHFFCILPPSPPLNCREGELIPSPFLRLR